MPCRPSPGSFLSILQTREQAADGKECRDSGMRAGLNLCQKWAALLLSSVPCVGSFRRLGIAAGNFITGSFGDKNPRFGVIILFRLAGAGICSRGATIVFAGFHDAIAFFHRRWGIFGRGG